MLNGVLQQPILFEVTVRTVNQVVLAIIINVENLFVVAKLDANLFHAALLFLPATSPAGWVLCHFSIWGCFCLTNTLYHTFMYCQYIQDKKINFFVLTIHADTYIIFCVRRWNLERKNQTASP